MEPTIGDSRDSFYSELTWEDLEDWAGVKIASRGQDYYRRNLVKDLSLSPNGEILAWVDGSERYATLVDVEDGDLVYTCTCPFDDGVCKHAVAVLLAYLESQNKEQTIPEVDENDPRLLLLEEKDLGQDDFDENEEDEYPENNCFDNNKLNHLTFTAKKGVIPKIHSYLEKQTKEQLIQIIEELADTNPAIKLSLEDRCAVDEDRVPGLVKSIRKEIVKLSQTPGWQNHWNGEGFTPDYSRIQNLLTQLLQKGHANEVVELGQELLTTGKELIEMSDDDGETASEIAGCLEIVFKALTASTKPVLEKMLWAIEVQLEDEYGLCEELDGFWEQKFLPEDWEALSEQLQKRLKTFPTIKNLDDYSWKYRRDRLSDWLITALQNAGNLDAAITLCEQEAELTGSYPRLVRVLIDSKKYQEAKRWIEKGILAIGDKLPGIVQELRDSMKQIRKIEKDSLGIIALYADEFFAAPSLNTYQALQKAAANLPIWPDIQEHALHFLETGIIPSDVNQNNGVSSNWPLPESGLPQAKIMRNQDFPLVRTLIDIAIFEKLPDKVVLWLDRLKKPAYGEWYDQSWNDQIATAIAEKYPDRAIGLWKKIAEGLINRVKPESYEEAAIYLRKISHVLLKLNQKKQWLEYIQELKFQHQKKRRLMEILNRFSDEPLVKQKEKNKSIR
jgi:uncharacterized Zn finger protein